MYKNQYYQLKRLLLVGGNLKLVVDCEIKKIDDESYKCTILKNISDNDNDADVNYIDVMLTDNYKHTIDQIQNLRKKTEDVEKHANMLKNKLGLVKAKLYELDFNDKEVEEQLKKWDTVGLTKPRLNNLFSISCPLHSLWMEQMSSKPSVQTASNKIFKFAYELVEKLSRYHFGLPTKSLKDNNVIVTYDLFNSPNDNRNVSEFIVSMGTFKTIDISSSLKTLFSDKDFETIRSIAYTKEGNNKAVKKIFQYLQKEFNSKKNDYKIKLETTEKVKAGINKEILKLRNELNETNERFEKGAGGGILDNNNQQLNKLNSAKRYRKTIGQYNLSIVMEKKKKKQMPQIDFDIFNFFGTWKFGINNLGELECENKKAGTMRKTSNDSVEKAERENYVEIGDIVYIFTPQTNTLLKQSYNDNIPLESIFAFAKSYRVRIEKEIEAKNERIKTVNMDILNIKKVLLQEWKKVKDEVKKSTLKDMLRAYYNAYVRDYEYEKNFPGKEFIRLLFANDQTLTRILTSVKKYNLVKSKQKCNTSANCSYLCALRDAMEKGKDDKEEIMKTFIASFFKSNSCTRFLPKSHLYKGAEAPIVSDNCDTNEACKACTKSGLKSFCFRMKCKCHQGLQGQKFLDALGPNGENIPREMGWLEAKTPSASS